MFLWWHLAAPGIQELPSQNPFQIGNLQPSKIGPRGPQRICGFENIQRMLEIPFALGIQEAPWALKHDAPLTTDSAEAPRLRPPSQLSAAGKTTAVLSELSVLCALAFSVSAFKSTVNPSQRLLLRGKHRIYFFSRKTCLKISKAVNGLKIQRNENSLIPGIYWVLTMFWALRLDRSIMYAQEEIYNLNGFISFKEIIFVVKIFLSQIKWWTDK